MSFITLHTSNEHILLNPDDNEALTCQTWNDLVEKAQHEEVPYVMITLCRHDTFSLYDTIMYLRTQQRDATVDPLTRLPIKEVVHLFAKTFDIETEDGNFIKKPPSTMYFQRFSPTFREELERICLEANNLHAMGEMSNKIVAQYQYIIGANLLKHVKEHSDDQSLLPLVDEAVRWFYCSSNRGCEKSREALADFPWDSII